MAKKLSPKKKAAPRRATKKRAEPSTQYSRDYPITGGHDYLVRSIPRATWRDAGKRAQSENDGRGRSIRNVIIRALELYAEKKLDLAPAHEPTDESRSADRTPDDVLAHGRADADALGLDTVAI
jgi:hypothetical protein